MVRYMLSVFIAGVAIAIGATWAVEPPRSTGVSDVIQRFEVPGNAGGFLLVPVRVADTTVLGAVDTGVSHSVYDSSLGHLLGKELTIERAETSRGKVQLRLFEAPDVTIGRAMAVAPRPAMAHCQDLSAIRQYSGQKLKILIGMDLLGSLIMRLDVTGGAISFLSRPPRNLRPIHMELPGAEPRLPWIDATASGIGPISFQIDTGLIGDCDGILRSDIYRRALATGLLHPLGSSNEQNIVGNADGRYAALRVPVEIREPAVSSHSVHNTRFAEGHSDFSYVGARFFSNCIATFDFPRGRAYFEPSVPRSKGKQEHTPLWQASAKPRKEDSPQ